MAQEPNPLAPGEAVSIEAGYAGSDTSGAGYAARGKDASEIQDDIRHTRAEMSETIQALESRFQPEYIKEQAKDAIRSTARDAGTTMLDTIKENPIPSIIAGLSLGWLIAKGGQPDRDRMDRERYEQDYYRYYGRYPDPSAYALYGRGYSQGYGQQSYAPQGYGQQTANFSGQGQDAAHGIADRAGDAADQVRDKVEDAAHAASDLAGQAVDQVQDWGHEAQRYGRQATNWLSQQMDENPLAVGAAALVAGALVGLSVPSTDRENELLGEKSDQLKEQARRVASEKIEQAKDVAEDVTEDAKKKAQQVADNAKDKADQKGLTDAPKTAGSMGSSSGSTSAAGSASSGSSGVSSSPLGGSGGTAGTGLSGSNPTRESGKTFSP